MSVPSPLRDVYAQHFAGRDVNLNVELSFPGADLQQVFAELLPLLRDRDVTVQEDGVIAAPARTLTIPPAQAEALGKFLAALPATTLTERLERYLTRLCVDPTYRQWATLYVPLAGSYQPVPIHQLKPTLTELVVNGDGPERRIERVRLPDLRTALDKHAAFILLAQPGAGKTTVLQRVALDLALRRLQAPDAEDARLPLYVTLAAQKPEEDPHTYLARMWRTLLPGQPANAEGEVGELLQQGRLCLLCDALNEARRDRFQERLADWRDFARALPAGNRLVFACRKQDYQGGLAVQQVEIEPLTPVQIAAFARNYLGAEQGVALGQALGLPEAVIAIAGSGAGDAADPSAIDDLPGADDHTSLLKLAAVPYNLRMLVDEFAATGDLTRNRAQLFEHFVKRLLTREEEKRHPVWLDDLVQQAALSDLAFTMQTLGDGTVLSHRQAVAALPATVEIPGQPPIALDRETVLDLASSASLLALRTDDTVQFVHHQMQEYFAAVALVRQFAAGEALDHLWHVPSKVKEMPDAPRGEWDPLPPPPTTHWEETTILAAGLHPPLVDTVHAVNPALAARCLLECGVEPDPARVTQSQAALLTRLESPAIHLRSRIEAGLLLGRLGDPRFPVETISGVPVIIPPLVAIPAATAAIGSGWWERNAEQRERPRHDVPLAGYALGRYAVTNAEYACFIEAGGYDHTDYWPLGGKYWLRGEAAPGEKDPFDYYRERHRYYTGDPQRIDAAIKRKQLTERAADNLWRIAITMTEDEFIDAIRDWYPQGEPAHAPRHWHDSDLNNPSQPVVGVTWYEAVAYANWLAAVTGAPFRLPTEPEWEWAARRGRRTYPWPGGWHQEYANSLEGRVMRTTPVGVYPQGATPDGLYEMAGNVYEWTATRYAAYPYQVAADLENLDAPGLRIARSGGWGQSRTGCGALFGTGSIPGSGSTTTVFVLPGPAHEQLSAVSCLLSAVLRPQGGARGNFRNVVIWLITPSGAPTLTAAGSVPTDPKRK